MKSSIKPVLVLALVLLAACSIQDSIVLKANLPPADPGRMIITANDFISGKNFEVIGYAVTFYNYKTGDDAVEGLRKYAAGQGADAVIHLRFSYLISPGGGNAVQAGGTMVKFK